jgi:predicted transposase/invertase (TIGR01784 family)
LSDILELHYIELRKFRPRKPQQLRTRFERWLYLLKFSDNYAGGEAALPDNLMEEEGIAMAIDSMRKAYARDEVREMILAREKAERDWISRLEHAEKKGREKGRAEGREEGGEERARRIARNLKAKGSSLEDIASVTGLSMSELEQL